MSDAHLNFYLDNGYIKRERKESAEERAQRIRMTLYGTSRQMFNKGGPARYKTGSRGGIKFEKDMEANAPDIVRRMTERVRKWTEKSGKEGQSWGRVPRDDPSEQLDLPMRMRKPRAAKPEPAPLVKGDYGSVDITPEYQAAQRFADEGKGQFTSIHTHPTGSPIPSGADISSWAHPINERMGLLENWYPRVPTPPHRTGEYRKTQPVQGANPFRWDKPSLSFEDMYILGMPGTLSRTAAADPTKAGEVLTRYVGNPASQDYKRAVQQWMSSQDWMKDGSNYYDSKAIQEMPWLGHGIGRAGWSRPINTTLGAAIGAPRMDDLAQRGLVDFTMDAKAAIPASGGHLWSDAIPDLQQWLKSQGHAKGGAVERLMGMLPERHNRLGRVAAALRKYRDPKSELIGDWKWRPLGQVAKDLAPDGNMGGLNPGATGYGRFMQTMADKANLQGLSAEDLAKAHQMTTFSMGRGAIPTSTLRERGWPDLPEHLQGDIRPEGAMAEWLRTPMGQQYAHAIAQGKVDPEAVAEVTRLLTPFGKQNEIAKVAERGAAHIPGQEGRASELVARAAQGASSPSEWHEFMEPFYGVRPAKHGFYGSLIGRGDLPTFDARQIIGQTGRSTAEANKGYLRYDDVSRDAVARLAARQEALGIDLPPELNPFRQHLWHHELWDRWGGSPAGGTTHQDLIDTMLHKADGGAVERLHDAMKPRFNRWGAVRKGVKALAEKVHPNLPKDVPEERIVDVIARDQGRPVEELMELLQRRKKGTRNAPADVTGVSGLMGRPFAEQMASIIRPAAFDRPSVRLEDLVGGIGVSGMSDRTSAGSAITSLFGNKLRTPLITSGGSDFPIYHRPDLWAAAQGPLTGMTNALVEAEKQAGKSDMPWYYLNKLMGREMAADQSHMAQVLAAHALKNAPVDVKDRELFDTAVRNYRKTISGETTHALPDFPGMADPNLLRYLINQPMTNRAGLLEVMDKAGMNKIGIPNASGIRLAIMDPALANVPEGTVGRTIGMINKGSSFNPKPDLAHPSYPVSLRGDFMGGTDKPVPPWIMFPDWWKGRDRTDPTSWSSWQKSPATQVFDQRWLDTAAPAYEKLQTEWRARGGWLGDHERYHVSQWQEPWA